MRKAMIPQGNAIFAFARAERRHLTPLPGLPFPTGGLGVTPTFGRFSVRSTPIKK